MFSIFSIPKPFTDPHISLIQENAIKSWLNLAGGVEVILCGADAGVAEICKKYGLKHIDNVARSAAGTPLLSSAFRLAQAAARYDIMVFSNADIILTKDFLKIFDFLPQSDFLVVGQRWDLDIDQPLDFSADWDQAVRRMVKRAGALHAPAGSDYFIFRKGSFLNLPPFAVGRVGWDNWMLAEAFRRRLLVIDATPLVKVVHQNHDYKHKVGDSEREDGKNLSLTGLARFLPTLRNVRYELRPDGVRPRLIFFRNFRQIIKKSLYDSVIKLLVWTRGGFSLLIRASKKMTELVNAPLFYLEQGECASFSDCRLLAKVLYRQPPNSDRYLEYPWMLENLKITSGRLLDVGSTASNMLYDFLPKSVEINSIDLNSKEIKNDAIKFAVGDIRQTDYADDYFDLISCISTLEHIGVAGRYGSDADSAGDAKAVEEMARILKPGGTLLVTVPYGSRDVLPLNKLYNKERISELFRGFASVTIEYKKYFPQFHLWLPTDEAEAARTDMIKDQWYAIAFLKVKK